MIQIPDVKGKSLRETKNKFDDWGLRYDQVKEINSFNTEKGKVVKTEPPIGSQVSYGDLITIYVSKRKTYPIFIVLFAVLLIGLLLGKGTISKIIENSKKKPTEANVCLLNCDTNGDGVPDTNLDTDGDGKCDSNCEGDVEQNGSGESVDGKKNDNPQGEKKSNEPAPVVRVETGKQGGDTVVKVVETKGNATTIKYSNGSKNVEYFTSGNGQTIAIGEYVIIGNSGTITFYAGNGSGGGSTTEVDVNPTEDDVTPPSYEVTVPTKYSKDPYATLTYDPKDAVKVKVLRGDQSLEDVKADGKDISTKKSYSLCGSEKNEENCTGSWTFGFWDKAGNGITETVTFDKYDSTKPSFTIDGDFITAKKTVSAIIKATDDNDSGDPDYFTIYYTSGKKTPTQIDKMSECKTSTIDNCKMRLVNNEHLGIKENDTYTFIVYDEALNYETSFTKTGGTEKNDYLTVENVVSELTPPIFNLNEYGWSTDKVVSIAYPDGGLGDYEYSLDGGNTWETYMDPIRFEDDGSVHEIIARVQGLTETLTSSSIVVTKIDNEEPEFEMGIGTKVPLGVSTSIPTYVKSMKSGSTVKCYYGKHGQAVNNEFTNLNQITELGYYDFKCTMVSGSGKTAPEQNATNVKVFTGVKLTFNVTEGGIFDDETCEDTSNECNEAKTKLIRNIEKGDSIGTLPKVIKDGYKGSWFTDATAGDQVSANQKPEENAEYYTHWGPGDYIIVLDSCGEYGEGCGAKVEGLEKVTKNIPSNSSMMYATNVPTPVWDGHIFIGWYSSNGQHVTSETKPTKSDTLKAHWMGSTGNAVELIQGLYDSGSYDNVLKKLDGTNIRYVGNNPDNYVSLNNGNSGPNFRIIGVMNVSTPNGNKKLVKLVGTKNGSSMVSGTYQIDSEQKQFTSSELKDILQTQPFADYAETVTFKVGSASLNSTFGEVFASESSSSDSYAGKVGLISISDIGYSSADSDVNTTKVTANNSINIYNSWLMKTSGYAITQNAYVMDNLATYSDTNKKYIYYLSRSSPYFRDTATTQTYAVYPTIYIPADAQITGGSGTTAKPFIININ